MAVNSGFLRCFTRLPLALFLALISAPVMSTPVLAACASPAGNEGDSFYSSAFHVMQYCNGTSWTKFGKPGSGGAGCSNPAGAEGAMIYNNDYHYPQFCDGATWRRAGGGGAAKVVCNGASCVTPGSVGYIVLSHDTWNGDLKTAGAAACGGTCADGAAGADALCLSDLTTYDWKGKADASSRSLLVSAHVTGMAPVGYSCHGPVANTVYVFAKSGDTTAGGAMMVTDASGYGPGDWGYWAASAYFNGKWTYWMGQQGTNGWSSWGACSTGSPQDSRCNSWTTSTSGGGYGGLYGLTTVNRFDNGTGDCSGTQHLICFVNP
jgi:hypothetical protein